MLPTYATPKLGPRHRRALLGLAPLCALLLCACPSSAPSEGPDLADLGGTGGDDVSADLLDGDTVGADLDPDAAPDGAAADAQGDGTTTEDVPTASHSGPSRAAPTAGGGTLRSERYLLQLTVGAPIQATTLESARTRAVLGVSAPIESSP